MEAKPSSTRWSSRGVIRELRDHQIGEASLALQGLEVQGHINLFAAMVPMELEEVAPGARSAQASVDSHFDEIQIAQFPTIVGFARAGVGVDHGLEEASEKR